MNVFHHVNTDGVVWSEPSGLFCSINTDNVCVPVGGKSSRGDGGHAGVVHQSRPVYQGVVSHHPVSWLPHQPGCHQDADQSGGEGSPRGPDQPAAWDSARTHTGNTHTHTHSEIIQITLGFDAGNHTLVLHFCTVLTHSYMNTLSSLFWTKCIFYVVLTGLWQLWEQCEESLCVLLGGHLRSDRRGPQTAPQPTLQQQGNLTYGHSKRGLNHKPVG